MAVPSPFAIPCDLVVEDVRIDARIGQVPRQDRGRGVVSRIIKRMPADVHEGKHPPVALAGAAGLPRDRFPWSCYLATMPAFRCQLIMRLAGTYL
jgi:hypothetical protein